MTFLTPSTVIIPETRGTVTVTSVMTTAGLWSLRLLARGHETPGRGPDLRSGSRNRDTGPVVRVTDTQGSHTETDQGEKLSTQTQRGREWFEIIMDDNHRTHGNDLSR